MKKLWVIALLGYSVIALLGCARIIEGAKGVAGLSTKALEEGRSKAIKKTFGYSYDNCYAKVKSGLKEIGSYIYAENANKKMIAIYVSQEDTTPVGIFFKVIDDNNTQVEVSSPSTYAKEFIAGNIFSYLEGTFKPKERQGKEDVQG